MGNSGSSRGGGGGGGRLLWPQKLFKKENKKKDVKEKKSKSRRNSAPAVAPMYDTVADVPVYSVVDKTRKRNIKAVDDVQYAEIEVVRRPTKSRSQKRHAGRPDPEMTEYATINFIPQESNATKRAITPPRKPVQDGGRAGQMSPYRRYNSVNGTLV